LTTGPKQGVPQEQEKVYTLSNFLESVPPNTQVSLSGFAPSGYQYWTLPVPEIRLFCSEDACDGYRFFSTDKGEFHVVPGKGEFSYVTYKCRNCLGSVKIFSLWVLVSKETPKAVIMKFGEWPEFGPPTPSRVITLIGPDRELFLKGRRSENQGLGIGAFGYYRRVVENQKNRILEQITKVSDKLGADPALLAELKAAQTETQFSKAVGSIKHGIPQTLLISGHNPLTLLHNALSEGLHSESDKECLELATSIRLVLTELADRMGQALKDEAELTQAVSRLLEVKAKKGG
jgi:hypothetical protein